MTAPSLPEFILARVAEDEAEVGPFPPYPGARDDSDTGPNGIGWGDVGGISEVLLTSHRRVLRQCEAFRRIVDLHTPRVGWEPYDQTCTPPAQDWITMPDECKTLRALASVWSDHEDFRAEWAA